MIYFSALFLGLITGLHCVGMCGALVFALPQMFVAKNKYLAIFIYHLGRCFAYLLIGLLVGIVGKGLIFAGFQQQISIFAGILMILTFVLSKFIPLSFSTRISTAFRNILKRTSYWKIFLMGCLNGFLPCGPVYGAASASLATSSVLGAMNFMFLFGIGTLPLLIFLSWFGTQLSFRFAKKLQIILPIFTIILGILFILRGLGLGILFISPSPQRLHL